MGRCVEICNGSGRIGLTASPQSESDTCQVRRISVSRLIPESDAVQERVFALTQDNVIDFGKVFKKCLPQKMRPNTSTINGS